MEDQGKRLLIAVVISMLILFGWSWWTARNQPPSKPAATEQAEKVTSPADGGAPGATGAGAQAPDSQPAAAQPGAAAVAAPAPATSRPRGPEQTLSVSMPKYEAVFSSYGGALKSFTLKGSQYHARVDGKVGPMDLVRTGDDSAWYPLQVSSPDSTFPIDPKGEWTLKREELDNGRVKITAAWEEPGRVAVTKTFVLDPATYAVEMAVRMDNRSGKPARQALAVDVFGRENPNAPKGGMFKYVPPLWDAACYANGELKRWSVGALKTDRTASGDVRWTGMAHKYFLLAVAPKLGGPREDRTCLGREPDQQNGVMQGTLRFPAVELAPNASGPEVQMVVFAGPNLTNQLAEVNQIAKGDTKLEAAVDWGPAPTSWFTIIARPMLSLLRVFHGWVRNWGLAIILLTIFVKLITLYWTQKSMRSMKEMGKLKPKIDELRERHKNDKERMNVEMMNLYKTHNINPLGGCLPMLLQLPIWMALYSALSAAAELHQAPFFGYIRDLTAPDQYFILPVVLTVLMFLQAKLSPTTVDSQQQKMMMYMMPIMFGVFSLFFPTGLTIYILTNTLLGMAHQVYMNQADTRSAVAVPAGGPSRGPAGGSSRGPTGGDRKRGKR